MHSVLAYRLAGLVVLLVIAGVIGYGVGYQQGADAMDADWAESARFWRVDGSP